MNGLSTITRSAVGLTLYEKMRQAVDECHRIDELINIEDRAAQIAAAAHVAGDTATEAKFRDIRVRAKRYTGKLLKKHKEEVGFRPGGPAGNGAAPGGIIDERPTLADMGLSRQAASDAQRLADIPDDEFETAMNNGVMPSVKRLLQKKREEPLSLDALITRVAADIKKHQEVMDRVLITRVASGKSLLALKRAFEKQGHDEEEWWAWFEGRFHCTRHRAEQRIKEALGHKEK